MLMKNPKHEILFWLGIISAIWFAFAGVFWYFLLALAYGYPAAILSLFCWYKIKGDKKPRNKIIPILLIIGLVISLAFLGLIYLNGEQMSKEAAKKEAEIKNQPQTPQGDNSRVSLDWNGIYKGVLPCLDCDSIYTTLQLNLDNTYTKEDKFYTKNKIQTFAEKGVIEWSLSGDSIMLNQGSGKTYFLVGENLLYAAMHQGINVAKEDLTKYALTKQ
jgi:hypothetical protein